jgi:hypothetical protein
MFLTPCPYSIKSEQKIDKERLPKEKNVRQQNDINLKREEKTSNQLSKGI